MPVPVPVLLLEAIMRALGAHMNARPVHTPLANRPMDALVRLTTIEGGGVPSSPWTALSCMIWVKNVVATLPSLRGPTLGLGSGWGLS